MTTQPNFLRYGLIFLGTYTAFIFIANLVVTFFNFEIGTSLNAALLISSVTVVSYYFSKNEKRKPERKEKLIISALCLAATFLVSIVTVVMVSVIENISIINVIEELSIPILLGALGAVTLLYFTAIYFIFGWFVSIYLKKIRSKTTK